MYEIWCSYYDEDTAVMDVHYVISFDTYEEAEKYAITLSRCPNTRAYVYRSWFEI